MSVVCRRGVPSNPGSYKQGNGLQLRCVFSLGGAGWGWGGVGATRDALHLVL